LQPFAIYSKAEQPIIVLIALLVCLIPTTIGALLSAIGIAGMDRLVQRNVLAMSGRAVEASGDVDVLLLDKTGTITLGNRQAAEFIPMDGVSEQELAEAAQLSSLADETPEGRSIVVLAKEKFGLRERELASHEATFVEFSATTRMSGVDMDGKRLRKGAADSVKRFVAENGGSGDAAQLDAEVDKIARLGGTPLVVAQDNFVLGVIYLKDVVKGGMRERFDELRRMGIRTVMITGDNRVTASVIAGESGVDDFLAEATPEAKLALIRDEQAHGRMVAMTGDGTNDAPALAQADVGVAMNTGTSAAKEAGNMVDLDSNPTKLIEIVEVGKQLLITRGALTTFSIANDVAKYFAILPAILAFTYGVNGGRGPLDTLNIMRLGTPESAITSAIIFNALIIPALVPLALRGVKYRAIGATALLRRNLVIYGGGGVILPFVGIKLIDLIVHNLLGAGHLRCWLPSASERSGPTPARVGPGLLLWSPLYASVEEAVTEARLGDDQRRVAGILLDAPPQLRDLHAQVVGGGSVGVAPDLRHERAVSHQSPGVPCEAGEQRELRRSELHGLAAHARGVLGEVERDGPALDLRRFRPRIRGPGVAQSHPHPGEQLPDGERLGHVVVRAEVERLDLHGILALRGQHDDRQRRVEHAHAPDHLEAVDAGQAEVEQHEIEGAVRDARERVLAAEDGRHRVVLGFERDAQGAQHDRLVVDEQDQRALHASIGSSTMNVAPPPAVGSTRSLPP
jgi:soluble P-type ATPase